MDRQRWEEVRDIFNTIREWSPAERHRFLAERCGRDPDIRREVEALLQEHGQLAEFLEQPALDRRPLQLALNGASAEPWHPLLNPGDRVGGFRIDTFIARGGTSEVYRATQMALSDRPVALKVMRATHFSAKDRTRFAREAEAVAHLHHPSLVGVLDRGEDLERGLVFYAMRYVAGPTMAELLGSLVESGPPAPDVRRLLVQRLAEVARALATLHHHGLVHRDVKPQNIILEGGQPERAWEGTAVLVDFGLVRPINQSATRSQRWGTPSYAAPEQLLGHPLDARADVFSLGRTMADLLRGQAPGERDSDAKPAVELDPDLAAIIARATEESPAWRYASASALAEDLEAWLRGDLVAARRRRGMELVRWLVVRHPEKVLRWLGRGMTAALLGVLVVTGAMRVVQIAGAAVDVRECWACGNWDRLRGGLSRVPPWLDRVVLPSRLASLGTGVRTLAGDDPLVQVLRYLDANDKPAAVREAACVLDRDGLVTQPELVRFLAKAIEEELDQGRCIGAVHLAERLFTSQPARTSASLSASAPIGRLLLGALERTEKRSIRTQALNVLSRCGDATALRRIAAWLQRRSERVDRDLRDEVLVALRCLREILARSGPSGFCENLSAADLDDTLRVATHATQRSLATVPQAALITVAGALAELSRSIESIRRAKGLPARTIELPADVAAIVDARARATQAESPTVTRPRLADLLKVSPSGPDLVVERIGQSELRAELRAEGRNVILDGTDTTIVAERATFEAVAADPKASHLLLANPGTSAVALGFRLPPSVPGRRAALEITVVADPSSGAALAELAEARIDVTLDDRVIMRDCLVTAHMTSRVDLRLDPSGDLEGRPHHLSVGLSPSSPSAVKLNKLTVERRDYVVRDGGLADESVGERPRDLDANKISATSTEESTMRRLLFQTLAILDLPLMQESGRAQCPTRLVEPGLPAGAHYGQCVSLSGNTLAVSAPQADGAMPGAGVVFIYGRDVTADTWRRLDTLFAQDGEPGDNFGAHDIQLDGDTLIVTANIRHASDGAVFVFVRDPNTNTWRFQDELRGGGSHGEFGHGAALSGDTIVVGEPFYLSHGAVRIFTRNHRTCEWEQGPTFEGQFQGEGLGAYVTIDGPRIAAKAVRPDGRGEVHVYVRDPTTCVWAERQTIISPLSYAGDTFGRELWLDGDTLVIPDSGYPNPSGGTGKAWLYDWNPVGGQFEELQELGWSGPGGNFGYQVVPKGDHLVATATGAPEHTYLFDRHGGLFRQVALLIGRADADFGIGASLDGRTLAIGAPTDDGTGATYVFHWPGIEIQGVSPDHGPSSGGNTVTIIGSGFADGSVVTFDEVQAHVVSVTTTQLAVLAPPRPVHDPAAMNAMAVRVAVQSPCCRAVRDAAYTYERR